MQGGEEVVLRVDVLAERALLGPIIGWALKNRVGQVLIGDNTFISYQFTPLSVAAGERFHASFRFQLPFLPAGDYAINVAVAEGTQQDHVQHHWIEDALFLKVAASHVRHSLVGIPMQEIMLAVDR
jgi:lipopolysaccharide transport system ATP-binding protein